MDNLEKEIIDIVNQHAKTTVTPKRTVVTKKDKGALKIGLKRVAIALFTAFLFALSAFAFIATATATGYWAVILFLSAIVLLVWAFVFLYAQGITTQESKGETK